MSEFVHLHCHSTWSLRDGAIPAEALPHVAAARGYDAVAMTDHDALTGAVRFARACRDAGVKPIYGAELTLEEPPRSSRRSRRRLQNKDHVTVIARNKAGYANLCRLISEAHLTHERDKPETSFESLAERAEGLFVLSGCARSEVARLAAAGRIPDAVDAAERWRNKIGEGYRIEVFDHRGYGHRALRDRLISVAKETGITPVATNDVHYAAPADAGTHELLHAIKEIVPLSRTQAIRETSEYYLKPGHEMERLFADVPEAIAETRAIADACDFDLDLGTYHFPNVPMPPGETPTGLLARRCFEGANRRYGKVTRAVDDRLQHELQLIFRMGFAAYFLLVTDIVDHAKHVLGIRCACRGSAAGSLVCYVLGISDVDPIRYDLLFERFMNARREELPDIDVDFESHRREDVLDYILETYGAEQTAICCMVDTFRARMAIREVGKALGLPPEEIDLVAKAFPRVRARDIPQAIERLPELSGTNLDGGQLQQLFELCIAIDGFPRHLALHPSGVVLSSPDLADRVPMQESFGGFTMLQADKDDVEELGLAKLDVLGVRMLSSIAHASDEIVRIHGTKIDLDAIARDDVATFELVRSSRTLGCFQIESPGQRELLARFQPSRFEDLIVDISLFRPGPVKSDMISPFLDRRHGFQESSYAHEVLRPILAETNGVVVYHEQVIRVIAAVTGCSLDDADYVRRHLDAERPAAPDDPDSRPGRKSSSQVYTHLPNQPVGKEWSKGARVHFHGVAGPIEIAPPEDDVGTWFKAGAVRNGFTPRQAEVLWKEVFSFASFGFCKSHAAAFALPTYISAWLKAHHPAEFLAGVLTHDPGMYPRRLIVADARQMGIPILPVDINLSDRVYRAEVVGGATAAADPLLCSDSPRSASKRSPFVALLRNSPSGAPPPPSPGSVGSAVGTGEGASSPPGFSHRSESEPIRRGEAVQSEPSLPLGIRLAFSEVREISEAEMGSILDARKPGPIESLEDLWRRTELSRPVLENLVHVGALDGVAGGRSRRELLWRAVDLASQPKVRVGKQLSLSLDEPIQEALPGLADYDAREKTEAELEITGIDARHHVMEHYAELVGELGCVSAVELGGCRNRSEAWVAGVKVASQTPAIRSGQRIIFVTLDELTGPIDVTVFERVQPRCARTIFHSWLLVVRGEVRKRGGASLVHRTNPTNVGITVVADEVFDLALLASDHRRGMTVREALDRQRQIQAIQGLAPGGADAAPSRLWHSSGGSAGR